MDTRHKSFRASTTPPLQDQMGEPLWSSIHDTEYANDTLPLFSAHRPHSSYGTTSQATEHWLQIKKELALILPAHDFQRWIEPLQILEEGPSSIRIVTPNPLIAQQLQKDFLKSFVTAKSRLGLEHLTINIQGALSENDSNPSPYPTGFLGTEETQYEARSEIIETGQESSGRHVPLTSKLNPNYTFQNFVRGPSNQFALATCLSVADNPGVNYNPLFLYGSTGLGKTHLLHAVGNHILKMNPEAIVAYISSERFMNEMIYCIRHNKMWDFRQKYRHCDAFMMDDIQFISGNKSATQEEFFHTFNTLYEAKKQIIITSDLFPQDIPDIEERLRNRFQWGLIADIQPPDIEHRIAILMNKAETLGVRLTTEVSEYIANHAKRNVRELEGALHRVAAFSALHGRPIDKHLAEEILHSLSPETPKRLNVEAIQKCVAEHFALKPTDLKSKKRHKAFTVPRQIAMYLSRHLTHASYPEIGEKFGGKDHTTIIHAVRKIHGEREKNIDMKVHLETLERRLEQNPHG